MTRENKLALVVGFGLILIVGILVSDHFSAARNQQSASLAQAIDPLANEPWNDPELIAVRTHTPEPATTLVVAPEVLPPSTPLSMPEDPLAGAGRTYNPAVSAVRELPFVFHEVMSGESLTSICRAYYGDASLIADLARSNEMSDPNDLRTGRRLRIPRAADLGRPASAPAQAPANDARTPGTSRPGSGGTPRSDTPSQTYTVQKNDSLSEIASRFLGSGRRYLALYEANRDVLKSPDALRPGMVLRIPNRER